MKTIKELNQKLDEIRAKVLKGELQEGQYGIKACKEAILWNEFYHEESLFEQYMTLVQRGLNEMMFNLNMIVACECLVFERLEKKNKEIAQ